MALPLEGALHACLASLRLGEALGLLAADRAALARPDIRASILAGAVEAVRPGSKGLANDRQLLFACPWGFRLEDVRAPVRLWYGEADTLVPVAMGEYLARALPNAHLTVYPGEGHMLLFTHWAEILRVLSAGSSVGEARSPIPSP